MRSMMIGVSEVPAIATAMGDRLGGEGGLPVELALLEEHVEERPADAGHELHHGGEEPGDVGHAAPLDVRPRVHRQRLDTERQQPEQQVDGRLVGYVGDQPQDRERDDPADRITHQDPPQHEAPPQRRAPHIGDELDDREQHHRGGDVEIDQQHAEQHHAARHPEGAGDEG
jgi:hypothetical protein